MSPTYERYAVYFSPKPETSLAKFGRKWLGVDPETKTVSPPPSEFVESPRRYGFHATLKAPMRLAPDTTYDAFRNTVIDLASKEAVISLGNLQLRMIDSFLALVTEDAFHRSVAELAWSCVKQLDHHRAPINDSERKKRTGLTYDQEENLETWGYPYVGSQFKFHMTLTSSLGMSALDQARSILEPQIPSEEAVIDAVSIFGDPGKLKPFELVERFPLIG